MKSEPSQNPEERKGYVLLWAGVLLAPMTWLLQFELRYSLVQWACKRHTSIPIHLVSLISFLLMATAGLLCWRYWKFERNAPPLDDGSLPSERNAFLAQVGMLLSSLFTLILLAQTLATIMVNPCRN